MPVACVALLVLSSEPLTPNAAVSTLRFSLVLTLLIPRAATAQSRWVPAAELIAPPTGCAIAATLLGGAAGFLVGAAAGAWIERALDSAEDAGITGLAVGGILGAVGGSQLAKKRCEKGSNDELRRRFDAQFSRSSFVKHTIAPSCAWRSPIECTAAQDTSGCRQVVPPPSSATMARAARVATCTHTPERERSPRENA
jgi:hypothetical protein